MTLTNQATCAVSAKQWKDACLHCSKPVDEFWQSSVIQNQEEVTEELIIELNGDNDSEYDDEEDGYHICIVHN